MEEKNTFALDIFNKEMHIFCKIKGVPNNNLNIIKYSNEEFDEKLEILFENLTKYFLNI